MNALPIAKDVLEFCRTRRETIAVVESCTGGLLAAILTAEPGASEAVLGGWVVYSNHMKEAQLGVPAGVLETHGAVSRESAEALAANGLARSGADHCLAITGIAGPGGGSPAKPVGTVWIARASATSSDVRRFHFPGDRAAIRQASAEAALAMLHQHLI